MIAKDFTQFAARPSVAERRNGTQQNGTGQNGTTGDAPRETGAAPGAGAQPYRPLALRPDGGAPPPQSHKARGFEDGSGFDIASAQADRVPPAPEDMEEDGEAAPFEDISAALAQGDIFDAPGQAVEAGTIRRLLLDHNLPNGVRITGAIITGRLDLSDLQSPLDRRVNALVLEKCIIREPIDLSHCHLPRLSLANSRLILLKADHTRIETSVDLRNVSSSDLKGIGLKTPEDWRPSPLDGAGAEGGRGRCQIALRNAKIGGNVDVSGATLVSGKNAPDFDYALSFSGSVIEGNVVLEDAGGPESKRWLEATGGVNFNTTIIRKNLWADQLRCKSADRHALCFQGTRIDGLCALRYGVKVWGSFYAALLKVGDAFHLESAEFADRDGKTPRQDGPFGEPTCFFIADDITVSGETKITNTSFGDIPLKFVRCCLGSLFINDVHGQFHLTGGTLTNNMDVARSSFYDGTDLSGLKIGGTAYFHFAPPPKYAQGRLQPPTIKAHRLSVGGSFHIGCLASRIDRKRSVSSLQEPSPITNRNMISRFRGELDFRESVVDGSLHIGDDEKSGLLAGDRAQGIALELEGKIDFRAAHINGNLNIWNVELQNYAGDDNNSGLRLSDMTVEDNIDVGNIQYQGADQKLADSLRYRCFPLICYPHYELVEVLFTDESATNITAFLLKKPKAKGPGDAVVFLDGTSPPFHNLNETGAVSLDTSAKVEEYTKLFAEFVWGEEGAFHIRERPEKGDPDGIRNLLGQIDRVDRGTSPYPPEKDPLDTTDLSVVDQIRTRPEDIAVRVKRVDEAWRVQALVQYANLYFVSIFHVRENGTIEMLEDHPLREEHKSADDTEQKVEKPFKRRPEVLFEPPFRRLIENHGHFAQIFFTDDQAKKMDPAALPPPLKAEAARQFGLTQSNRPFIIDLRGSSAEVLNDKFGSAWRGGLEPESKNTAEASRLLIRLDGLTYSRTKVGFNQKKSSERWIMRLDWLKHQMIDRKTGEYVVDATHHRPQPYRQLISVYKAMGYDEAARRIAERLAKLNAKVARKEMVWRRPFAKAWDLFFGGIFAYGLSTSRSLTIVILFWMFGILGTWAAQSKDLMAVDVLPVASELQIEQDGTARRETLSLRDQQAELTANTCRTFVDAAVYAADLMLPVVDFRQEHRCTIRPQVTVDLVSYPTYGAKGLAAWGNAFLGNPIGWIGAAVNDPRHWLWLRSLYILLGWIVVSLTILTVTGVLRRQGVDDRM